MIVYRFSHQDYVTDISGTGARLKGGRWNLQGTPVVYASEHISLAVLEIIANAVSLSQLASIELAEIIIPDDVKPKEIRLTELKNKWWDDVDYSQWLGTEILRSNESLLIRCPSSIIHTEHNYLVNPNHKDFKKVKVRRVNNFYFDPRLFK
jgi:RES domain-containing protein